MSPIAQIRVDDFMEFLAPIWSDESDALTPKDVRTITGYSSETVTNWIWLGRLKVVRTPSGKIVAKQWLIEFIASYTIENPNRLSQKHKMIAEAYIEQSSN